MRNILDTREMLGYRLLSDAELSVAAVTSAKMSTKDGRKHIPDE